MVAGCLYPILKSILKTEGKILSQLQWAPWSCFHLHSMRAWPCDLNPRFVALAKLTALLVAGHRMRKRFRVKALWSHVPAAWGEGEAGPCLCSGLLLPFLLLFPSAPLPGKAAPSSCGLFLPSLSLGSSGTDRTTRPLPRLHTGTRTFWCRRVLVSMLLQEEPCIRLTCFFMVTSLFPATDFFF